MSATNAKLTNGDHNPPKLKFVVVGGSLGGLAAGIALKEQGHDIIILERSPTPLLHSQGAGIVAGGDSLAFFNRYNRCDQPIGVPSSRRQYLSKDGTVVHTVDTPQSMSSWDLTYHLLRANYDGHASAYCTPPPPLPHHGSAVHLHNHTVTSINPLTTGLEVHYHSTTDPSSIGSLTCDRLIAADGPSSTIRTIFSPSTQRTYAGYCALRGTVPESAVTPTTHATFANRFTFHHGPGIQILAYLIPGLNGTVTPGERLINFVYYTNFPASSPSLAKIMTDRHGHRHNITIPPGLVCPIAWEEQKQIAIANLPPQFAEIVCAAEKPFVQAVTDVISPDHEFLDGRVVLVGDALAGFRPHTVASTSQAALDAMLYADYMAGNITRDEWKRETTGYARHVQQLGIKMGVRSQTERLSLEEYIQDRDDMSVDRRDMQY
ncbi:hypothetical protein OQA88_4394 [Cercophora sp. LCS_1]